MESLRIDILNPKAKKLLKNLAELNLIKINPEQPQDLEFMLNNLRSRSGAPISLEDITSEVDTVRKKRYEG